MYNIPKRYRDIKRFEEILSTFVHYELGSVLEKLKLKKLSMHTPNPENPAANLRMVFEDLGGSFVKLGQLLSLRPDLVPLDYCEELAKLQDNVKPFSSGEAKDIIEKQLGKDLDKIFDSFVLHPVASASIGQVHRATLKTGEEVAVKVKRPGISEKMAADIDIVTYIANLIEKHWKPEIFSATEIVNEFKDYTEKELDFVREANNIDTFYTNFHGTNVVVPKVYWDYCSEDVIVMEFIDGIECKDVIFGKGNFNHEQVAKNLSLAFFKQVFEDGVFHADPHPSNILVLEGNTIALLDFGIVGRVSQELKEHLGLLFFGLVEKNTDWIVEAFLKMEVVNTSIDLEAFKTDLIATLGRYYDTPISSVNFSDLIKRGFEVARNHHIKLPKNFVLLNKAIMTLESTCAELYPDYNFVEVARPYTKSLMKKNLLPSALIKKFAKHSKELVRFVEEMPQISRKAYDMAKSGDHHLSLIEEDLRDVRKEMSGAATRLSLSLLICAFMVSAALVASMEQPSLFNYPAYSFIACMIAVVLLLALLLSWLEDKLRWRST
ncbi:ABC1 kinase family protein [Nanoarchaeota archaeon]